MLLDFSKAAASFHEWITADSVFWTVFGLSGNILFSSRFVLQWIVSEKEKRSTVPIQFWYLSIAGSVMMLIYSIHLWKLPLILGFAFPVLIYMRNIALSKPAVEPADENTISQPVAVPRLEEVEPPTPAATGHAR